MVAPQIIRDLPRDLGKADDPLRAFPGHLLALDSATTARFYLLFVRSPKPSTVTVEGGGGGGAADPP